MPFMSGLAASWSLKPLGPHGVTQALCAVLLAVLVTMNVVLGDNLLDIPSQSPPLNQYLHCYRCLLETEELGCLLGSDTCLTPLGSTCVTLHIKNSSGFNVMVSDCRNKEQMVDCSYTRASPVFGFWIFYQCCFLDFCNNPKNRKNTMH
ncbi:lymphocyte antigen 6 complex, locus G5C [Rattus norvegicus]|uniref:Lymphocyte antigen 6 complex locus protein G5c n=2 Tax=Rattus norvegicus TaxID=10116 RepID=A6KTT8_RAT|nr:lymphocyte antigen 6 complex locus protein G5c [Rattus norvegicus]EDL83518.1 lymphocyte antigen 6 complex, locus G5C [Rattus norvegicus]|eukprot:NP_942034.3 lymphocyte antigen 6 complex locus protein G5c [Rattus norvegicus]